MSAVENLTTMETIKQTISYYASRADARHHVSAASALTE